MTAVRFIVAVVVALGVAGTPWMAVAQQVDSPLADGQLADGRPTAQSQPVLANGGVLPNSGIDSDSLIEASDLAGQSDSVEADVVDVAPPVANDFLDFGSTEWEDSFFIAPGLDDSELEEIEPISVPEPSAFAMLAMLAGLLLAMTMLRWHFDHSSTGTAAASK